MRYYPPEYVEPLVDRICALTSVKRVRGEDAKRKKNRRKTNHEMAERLRQMASELEKGIE